MSWLWLAGRDSQAAYPVLMQKSDLLHRVLIILLSSFSTISTHLSNQIQRARPEQLRNNEEKLSREGDCIANCKEC